MTNFTPNNQKCNCGHLFKAHVEDGSCFFSYNCDCKKFNVTCSDCKAVTTVSGYCVMCGKYN